jgi:hypothetical protein
VVTGARALATLIALAASLTGAAATPRTLDAHPLHTTMTELSEDRARGVVRATIRVFADDFGTAVSRWAKGRAPTGAGSAWEAAAIAYAASAFNLQDAGGRPLAMRSCGVRRTADLVWVCLEAATAQPLGALRVRNAMLCELFDDQVNVVQGSVASGRRSLLFVRGDPYKSMR